MLVNTKVAREVNAELICKSAKHFLWGQISWQLLSVTQRPSRLRTSLVSALMSWMVRCTICQLVWWDQWDSCPSYSPPELCQWRHFCSVLRNLLKMSPSFILLRSPGYCRARNALTVSSPKDLSLKKLWFTINFALKVLGFSFQPYFNLKLVSALSTCIVDWLLLAKVCDSVTLPARTHRCKTN